MKTIVFVVLCAMLACSCSNKSDYVPQVQKVEQSSEKKAEIASDYHDNIYLIKTDQKGGSYLTDFGGTALYVHDEGKHVASKNDLSYNAKWKPYSSGAMSQSSFPKNISVIKRDDGTQQFAWKGMPLYYSSADTNAGMVNGDGAEGIWHVARP